MSNGRENPDPVPVSPEYEPSLVKQLKAAMCPATMLETLRRDWQDLPRKGLDLAECQAVRVYPRDGGGFVLEYEMRFRVGDGETVEQVFGELVGERAEDRYRKLLGKLEGSGLGAASRDAAPRLIACLPRLGLVLRSSRLDYRLHGLRLMSEPEAAAPILSRYVVPDGSEITGIAVDVLGHRLGKRCTQRVRFQTWDSASGRRDPHSVIAKLYKFRSDRGEQVARAMRELWERGFGDEDDIRIPKFLGYLADWRMLLMEDAPGISLSELEGPDLIAGVAAAGRALAKLHRCPVAASGRYTVDDEVGLLQRWGAVVSGVYPEQSRPFEEAFLKVRAVLERCRRFEPALVHRDFYEKQVLLNGTGVVLIDFDTVCISDPALDVGNFLAHLMLAGLKRQASVEGLENAFLVGYGSVAAADLGDRVEAYTQSSLLRLACLYSIWPKWSHIAEPLLEQIE